MGLAFTSVGALIAETVDSESRGLAMGGYNTCIYFGMMLNSALMGTLIQMIGFKYAFYLTAVVNLFFIAIFYFLMQNFSPIRNEPVR
jgi:DHA1 family multidrug resistance protein-like MFS transporter